jgi:broad specificity phosphatase PhoE
METASIIASCIGMPEPTPVADIVERNYGEAEGMTGPELEAFYPNDTPVPGRETREAVKARVIAALHAIAAENKGKNVIVVAHGGVIRAVLQSTTGHAFFGERITNGSVHSFHHSDDGLQLVQFNDPLELLTDDITLPDFEDQQPLERRD